MDHGIDRAMRQPSRAAREGEGAAPPPRRPAARKKKDATISHDGITFLKCVPAAYTRVCVCSSRRCDACRRVCMHVRVGVRYVCTC